jgi:hypothetical protein
MLCPFALPAARLETPSTCVVLRPMAKNNMGREGNPPMPDWNVSNQLHPTFLAK